MRASSSLLALILIATPLCLCAQGVELLRDRLAGISDFQSNVKFEVFLPSSEEPVTYDLALQSRTPVLNDSLSPCDFIIKWNAMSPSGMREGFSAYFDGNYYRFRNNKLQEYHFQANPNSFQPAGAGSQFTSGVHSQDQFAGVLPQYLALKLAQMENDSSFTFSFHPDTIVSSKRSMVVEGSRRNNGYDSEYFTYIFDYDTAHPLLIDRTTSPGSISEQIITTTYSYPPSDPVIGYTEEDLINTWPEVFEKYRTSNFKAENLAGNFLPEFSVQLLGSDSRLQHNHGEPLERPSIIAFIDLASANAEATIQALREAETQLPLTVDILWAFNSNRIDEIEELTAPLGMHEKALPSANSLIRNCGITLFPTILLINSDSSVQDVITAYNKNLSSDVIQKAFLLK